MLYGCVCGVGLTSRGRAWSAWGNASRRVRCGVTSACGWGRLAGAGASAVGGLSQLLVYYDGVTFGVLA